MESVTYCPIGVIHSGHVNPADTPIQPVYAPDCEGRAEIRPEFAEGLRDLEGFSHVFLLYHFHRAGAMKLTVKPFLQETEHGVFATRSPLRPNPIGISIVELLRVEGNVLHLRGVDILDGTPLLDIKPYTAKFDLRDSTRNGWQDEVNERDAQALGMREYQAK
jgi:tRNA (adenine37-N6)-methyltransferase